jgi:sialic acid synthase SpsE
MTRLFEAKPYIVAEVGSNWASREDAVASIGAAKAAGADCVKFQAFDWESLYGPNEEKRRLEEIADLPGCPTRPLRLPLAWLPALKEKAHACGIDFACTAFSPELVAAVDPFVPWHKVASSDATWPQLLEAVAATGKPIVLSVGAKSRGDIAATLQTLGGPAKARTVLMYCVSAYPARTIDLRVMAELNVYGLRVGFSDHSTDIVGHPVAAARQGAVVIEKHFTAFPELDTPDRPHSLTADEFQTMVENIRGTRRHAIGPTPEERDMLLKYNRRLLATRDIAAGDVFTYGHNFGAYRSLVEDTRGFSPFMWRHVEGGIALAPIERGEAIGPGDFSQGNACGKTPRHLWPEEYR